MAELKKGNNEFVTLSPELIKSVRVKARAWAEKKAEDETAKGNPWMQKVTASYYDFQDKWVTYGDYRLGDQ